MLVNRHPSNHQRNGSSRCGQSLSEYAIVLGLIVLVGIPALMLLGQQNQNGLGQVSQKQSDFDNLSGLLTRNSTSTINSTSTLNSTSGNGRITPPNLSAASNTSLAISSNSIQIGNNSSFQYAIDANTGKLTFTDSKNSTSIEGSTVTKQLATQLKALAQEFETTGSPEEANKFNDLAIKAFNMYNTQKSLEVSGLLQSNNLFANGYTNGLSISTYKNQYNQLIDQYTEFSDLSQSTLAKLPQDSKVLPQLTTLVALGQNITYQNFIQPLNEPIKSNPNAINTATATIAQKIQLEEKVNDALDTPPIKAISDLPTTAGSAETLQVSKDIQALP
ncbi:MAG: hypothetical protein K2X66_04380 [Cyanobacteria bacterium]|nr:hypothetical protein [Cyanobacteriota bacterium]